jgi:hypothetical protein
LLSASITAIGSDRAHNLEAKDVSKKRYVDDIEDLDDSTFSLLGSRLTRIAREGIAKDRFRERRANDRQDYFASAPKVKRMRDRPE